MRLRHLELIDFRNYERAACDVAAGFTALLGDNGQGKTNLLEAIGYLATLGSIRRAPTDALVRAGADRAVIRAAGEREGRELLIEAELGGGRHRVQVNRQPLGRGRDLLGVMRVSVFSPDDLALVKGGPVERRRYLDDALASVHPKYDALRTEVERTLRQRNALLRQSGGRLTDDVGVTLDVWDERLAASGEELAGARARLLERLGERIGSAYDRVARAPAEVTTGYDAPWRSTGLAAALAAARDDDLRRRVTTVGPHRDELQLAVGGLPARTHASQGEQRSLSLALRLAAHGVVTDETGTAPLLLLDDVFSELDPDRSAALLEHLPPDDQRILTSASGLPASAKPDLVLTVRGGVLHEEGPA